METSGMQDYTAIFWLVTLLTMYLVPAIVAMARHHHNGGAIFALNLLLGWTLIGWVASLVWALTATATAPVVVITDSNPRSQ